MLARGRRDGVRGMRWADHGPQAYDRCMVLGHRQAHDEASDDAHDEDDDYDEDEDDKHNRNDEDNEHEIHLICSFTICSLTAKGVPSRSRKPRDEPILGSRPMGTVLSSVQAVRILVGSRTASRGHWTTVNEA